MDVTVQVLKLCPLPFCPHFFGIPCIRKKRMHSVISSSSGQGVGKRVAYDQCQSLMIVDDQSSLD